MVIFRYMLRLKEVRELAALIVVIPVSIALWGIVCLLDALRRIIKRDADDDGDDPNIRF